MWAIHDEERSHTFLQISAYTLEKGQAGNGTSWKRDKLEKGQAGKKYAWNIII